jgi:hypothetical protein
LMYWPSDMRRRSPGDRVDGRVFASGRETAFPAAGGSLCSRGPWLLVSVNALPGRIRTP